MFVTRGSKNSLFSVFDFLSSLDCGQWYKSWICQSLPTGKEYKIFCNVNCKTPNVVYFLDCHVCGSQYVGESVQPFNKRMNWHRSDLTKKTLLPVSQHFVSPGHSLEDFGRSKIYRLQLETALVTLVTTWFTLADRRWRSRYRSSDQCILSAFSSPERYNGWFREQLGQRFTFFNFFPMMTDNACNFL
jgi:hypothetical protein